MIRNTKKPRIQVQSSPSFPPAWVWLVDEAIPNWVKRNYSPRESWKDKPFSVEDSRFFFTGIEDLSELFTEERARGTGRYFEHPKYRSAYLLYFLPLQAAKFLSILQTYPDALLAALNHAEEKKVLRIADLGAGPGTASLSLLLLLLNHKLPPGKELPRIELEWFDTNTDIMKDGQALVEQLSNSFPKLRGRVHVNLHSLPWWKAPTHFSQDFSLVFLGHLLNESSAPQKEIRPFWESLFSQTQGGGILMIEPAARRPSQILSTLRDEFIESGLIENSSSRIWGPCLHAGKCPLAEGRDWCHFSIPSAIPGKWFRGFSEGLGSERQWLKLSYLWIASAAYPAPQPPAGLRRVISDPLNAGPKSTVLTCEPETPGRWTAPAHKTVWRGDLVQV